MPKPKKPTLLPPSRATGLTKFNDATTDKVLLVIAEGLPVKNACLVAGITPRTFYNWKKKGASDPEGKYGQFFQALQMAESSAMRQLLGEMMTIARDRKGHNWQAFAWLLERRFPADFGRGDRNTERNSDAELKSEGKTFADLARELLRAGPKKKKT